VDQGRRGRGQPQEAERLGARARRRQPVVSGLWAVLRAQREGAEQTLHPRARRPSVWRARRARPRDLGAVRDAGTRRRRSCRRIERVPSRSAPPNATPRRGALADADADAHARRPKLKQPQPKNSITLFEQGPLGKLVGEDVNGNRYYENNEGPYGAFLVLLPRPSLLSVARARAALVSFLSRSPKPKKPKTPQTASAGSSTRTPLLRTSPTPRRSRPSGTAGSTTSTTTSRGTTR
jgi:hypothetical protein